MADSFVTARVGVQFTTDLVAPSPAPTPYSTGTSAAPVDFARDDDGNLLLSETDCNAAVVEAIAALGLTGVVDPNDIVLVPAIAPQNVDLQEVMRRDVQHPSAGSEIAAQNLAAGRRRAEASGTQGTVNDDTVPVVASGGGFYRKHSTAKPGSTGTIACQYRGPAATAHYQAIMAKIGRSLGVGQGRKSGQGRFTVTES